MNVEVIFQVRVVVLQYMCFLIPCAQSSHREGRGGGGVRSQIIVRDLKIPRIVFSRSVLFQKHVLF